ncbi:Gti1/Pac2 family-domain-containing protein [Mariannaea sp. PMI_226]|nr:Gti1/Pac2 family-domain-containing protein [Mariannaea sp. PMI_226]
MAMSGASNPLNCTFEGHIASTIDALVLFEACLSGQLNHVPRRPHDRERQDLIKSGNVFIYEEHASGIKRWTDGVSWSPSRILGNFLIYRELEKPFPPGEKKRALKKSKKPQQQGVAKTEGNNRQGLGYPSSATALEPNANGKDTERALIGSLIDSYPFKNDGLVKKTISVTYQGVPHHLVSYYNVNDVISGRLSSPTKHPALRQIIPRTELITSQNFRAPIDEVECGQDDRFGLGPIYTPLGGHEFHGSILQRAMSLPNFQPVQGYHYGAPAPHYGYHAPPPPPPQPQHFTTSMAPSTSPMPYASQPQGNYALDPNRSNRYQPTAGNMAHEFPRNMPTHSPQRRHSLIDSNPSTDLSNLSMIPPPPPFNGSYLSRSSGITGHDHTFSPPRQVKGEADGPDDGSSQQYGLEENTAQWSFDAMNGAQDDSYFSGNGASSGQWSQ